MGLALILGGILMILLIVGVIGIIIGTIILIVRYVKKKKTGKNYKVSKVLGIIFIILGLGASAIPLWLAGNVALGVNYNIKKDEYLQKQVDTKNIIEVQEGKVTDFGSAYNLTSFKYNYIEYHKIDGIYVKYKDKYRKGAVANITDGKNKGTVYKYVHPKGNSMLSIHSNIFATADSIEKLTKYYNDECEFTYMCDYYKDGSRGDFSIDMEDKQFIGIVNCDKEYVSDVEYDYEWLYEYDIKQTSDDKRIERCIEINICEDDRIIINIKDNPLGKEKTDTDQSIGYELIDKETKEKFIDMGNEILKRVEE